MQNEGIPCRVAGRTVGKIKEVDTQVPDRFE
jgi:hypothetical protein